MTTTGSFPDRADLFPDRTEAVRVLAAAAKWTVLDVHLASYDARGDTFVTGHLVDVVDDEGRPTQHTVFLDTASEHPATVPIEGSDGQRLSAWLYPADPSLPALSPAVHSATAATILDRLGIDSTDLALDVLSYRPGKRAVIRVTTATRTLYLKIVRPDKVEALCRQHAAWRGRGLPAPEVLSWSPDGLIVLAPLDGSEAVGMLDLVDNPSMLVEAVRWLSDQIALVPSSRPARPSLARRLDWYSARLTQFSPESVAVVNEVCDAIARLLSASGAVPSPVTIHGDLHLGQVFLDPVDPRRVLGVLDIDTAGYGDPADDGAALVAHVLASADLMDRSGHTGQASRARRTAREFTADWVRLDDPGFESRARAIAATHLLGHCLSGALDVDRGLALAREMLEKG